MAVIPHTADIVVKDMGAALAFYRLLGLDIPEPGEGGGPHNYEAPNGFTIGFMSEAMLGGSPMGWVEPVGQRISLAFRCDTVAEVEATYARIVGAGHPSVIAPVDTPWNQRYACVRDADGNRVDLFAELG